LHQSKDRFRDARALTPRGLLGEDAQSNKVIPMQAPDRRPLASRNARWAQRAAAALARSAVTPNQISLVSIVFALAGAAALVGASPIMLVFAAICVQLRLLCNLLDGMVAIEGGKQSAVGALYNEFPDRIADSLLLVALGFGAGVPWLGWLAALLAALTAYVRVTGGALGLPQDFRGPMAKPQRMAVLTLACVVGAAEMHWNGTRYAVAIAAILISAGAAATCARRTRAIARLLRER
jgi:phosphatidylglycerophosphate synthase